MRLAGREPAVGGAAPARGGRAVRLAVGAAPGRAGAGAPRFFGAVRRGSAGLGTSGRQGFSALLHDGAGKRCRGVVARAFFGSSVGYRRGLSAPRRRSGGRMPRFLSGATPRPARRRCARVFRFTSATALAFFGVFTRRHFGTPAPKWWENAAVSRRRDGGAPVFFNLPARRRRRFSAPLRDDASAPSRPGSATPRGLAGRGRRPGGGPGAPPRCASPAVTRVRTTARHAAPTPRAPRGTPPVFVPW